MGKEKKKIRERSAVIETHLYSYYSKSETIKRSLRNRHKEIVWPAQVPLEINVLETNFKIINSAQFFLVYKEKRTDHKH